ncbi:MAG: pyridoxamine 5'-phosphate oxidase family protein [Chloroflexi bacterium]|nr:pyridoxamine 5'-phosphate oxidase family protein [Chloroflexota bacterium]
MTDEISTGQLNKTAIDEFLARPLLARLATADPVTGQPHVVPLWYGWDGTSIWISSFRSTRKIRELQKNPRCSIVIDLAEEGKETKAVILEGEVELVTAPFELLKKQTTWVYTRYLGPEGVLAKDPQSWIADPENLLIKLIPAKIMSWGW